MKTKKLLKKNESRNQSSKRKKNTMLKEEKTKC